MFLNLKARALSYAPREGPSTELSDVISKEIRKDRGKKD